jgi:hypothetical protein
MLFLALAVLPVTRDFACFDPAALAARCAGAGSQSFRIRAASLLGSGRGLYRTTAAVVPGHCVVMLGNGRGCFSMTRCRMLRLNHLCRNRHRPGAEQEYEENRQNPGPSCASLNHESIFADSRFVRL